MVIPYFRWDFFDFVSLYLYNSISNEAEGVIMLWNFAHTLRITLS